MLQATPVPEIFKDEIDGLGKFQLGAWDTQIGTRHQLLSLACHGDEAYSDMENLKNSLTAALKECLQLTRAQDTLHAFRPG